ncbi:MAG: immune inhibitor A, partial [Anaerolineaceae bacterium]|nr:immune inhibitor A [Anaerolineaceae bacterium]
ETISACDNTWWQQTVNQYGVDYYRISCRGTYMLTFEGSTEVDVIPEDAYSGDYAFWSNKGDNSDMTLTRMFDFSAEAGPLTLEYWTWYDLEEDYDYLYLLASEDGENWEIITTPSGTDEDPNGNSYGWAYNGMSAGWIKEVLDISDYAGKEVYLRFEYITDAGANGEGMLIDDIAVPEVGYSSDFETDAGGWEPEGFVRIQNRLPQTFVVSLVYDRDGEMEVERVELNADQGFSKLLELGLGEEVVLVVSGTTRYIITPAEYQFKLE